MHPPETDHLTDEQLIAIVLGEHPAVGLQNQHPPCAQCTLRVQRLQEQWGLVRSAIIDVELPPGFTFPALRSPVQARTRLRGWMPSPHTLRIAAGICLLIVTGALSATGHLGAWIASLRGGPPASQQVAVQPVEIPPTPERRAARISFLVDGSQMRVNLSYRQSTGRLILYLAAESSATFEVADPLGNEIPLISEDGVQVRNSPSSSTDYRVGVPAGVTRVRIQVGDGPSRLIRRADIPAEIEIGATPREKGSSARP